MTKELRCPYCKRRLKEDEKHCWFCEQDVSNYVEKELKRKGK